MQSHNEKVNKFLEDLHSTLPDKAEIVEQIRLVFLDQNPKLDEDIKYGGIVFNLSQELLGGIFVYKQHISIEFSYGAEFTDKAGLLEGKGKLRRHLKVLDTADITHKKLKIYVQQAVSTAGGSAK